MIKIFETGDLHIGRKFERYPDAAGVLIESRFECLDRMVKLAEEKDCSVFAVTGDTFDNVGYMKVGDVKRVVDILSSFSGTVLMLPGNHDYYSDDVKVWESFRTAMNKVDHNIVLLKDFKPLDIEIGDETLRVYPACCQSKHASDNNLGWIKSAEMGASVYNVGMAHGAIKGITPDKKEEYFLMTESELNAVPVDVWLIGHTHIPYPALEPGREYSGYKIHNAGTPEQLDLHNNTMGYGYVITLDKKNGVTSVVTEAVHTGRIEYRDIEVKITPDEGMLEKTLQSVAADADKNTIIRLTLKGMAAQAEYDNRYEMYRKYLSAFLSYEYVDAELSEQITEERIKDEFPELGFAAALLEELMSDPAEVQMAYALLKECRE